MRKYQLVYEKDVKSSVPRLTASLNAGEWIPEDKDIYRLIYNLYINMKYPNYVPEIAIPPFEETRAAIKELHMRCYFDTPGQLVPHTLRALGYSLNQIQVGAEMRILREAVEIAEGGQLYDNEIFYYESVIYGRVLKQLLDEGFFVWMCYDAFYSTAKDGWSQERFEQHVCKLIEQAANDFIAEKLLLENTKKTEEQNYA